MRRFVLMSMVVAVMLGSLVAAEETKQRAPRVTGKYNALDLTPEQKEKIAAIQTETKEKIKQIQEAEKNEIEALLTDVQKEKLAGLIEAEAAKHRERAKAYREKKQKKERGATDIEQEETVDPENPG